MRRPANLAIAARFFSQTARVANAEEERSAAAAADAIAAADGAEEVAADGAEAPAASPRASNPGDEGETPHGVFIRNIVFDASEAHLQEAFEHYGPVSKSVIARDARGMSRGYGFVWFESEEAVAKALAEANGSFWHGRRLIVMPRTGRQSRDAAGRPSGGRGDRDRSSGNNSTSSRPPTNSLYIGNLPYETTDADLNVVFREIEGLKAVRVAVDRSTGWPRGFAHADFDTVEHATIGYEYLQNKEVGSRVLRIDYASPSRNTGNQRNNQADGTPSESTLRQQ